MSDDPPRGSYPFLFFHHGVWDFERAENRDDDAFLWFEEPVPPGALSRIEIGAPGIYRYGSPQGPVLQLAAGRDFAELIHEVYGEVPPYVAEKPTRQEVEALCAHLDRWLLDLHARLPVVFFSHLHGAEDDPWHRWSVDQVPARVLPKLRAFWEGARAPEQSRRKVRSPEALASWALYHVTSAYLRAKGVEALDPTTARELEWLLARAMGHAPGVDPEHAACLRAIRAGRSLPGAPFPPPPRSMKRSWER